MRFSEDISFELEALKSVYDEDAVDFRESTDAFEIEFRAFPRTIPGQERSFVHATLVLSITEDYPATIPRIEISAARGLGLARQKALLEALLDQARDLEGEASLLALCEVMRDGLDEMNAPEGDCVICLEKLMNDNSCLADLVLCPCYHSFHKACFQPWWSTRQHEMCAKEQELVEKMGGGCLKVELPKKQSGHYVLHCPICRAELTIDDLDVAAEAVLCEPAVWDGDDSLPLDQILSTEQLAFVQSVQQKWKSAFESQQSRGAFFKESPFVLSLPPVSPHSCGNSIECSLEDEGFR